tara:strand:- start:691 stop:963 length:273 start_codon:yes stop_codon:yes gene_type:complete
MKNLVIILSTAIITSCATVGAVIDGGKDLSTSIIDSTVKTAGNITTSALEDVSGVIETVTESTEDVVENVVDEVDQQTNELESSDEEDIK